jgi:murein DD-endopeptidase MepM/ murein hydrolase activator NlpD
MGLNYYQFKTPPAGRPSIGKDTFMFPLTLPSTITSLFGWRIHPMTGEYRFHGGTDLGAPEGTPVIAAVSGQVVAADFLGGYGLTVVLQHEQGMDESLYAHLSEIFVRPGDRVEQGNVIGRVGSTGNSTGPHLHFEWRHLTPDGWVTVDAGAHLEYSLAQFITALQIAQPTPQRGF